MSDKIGLCVDPNRSVGHILVHVSDLRRAPAPRLTMNPTPAETSTKDNAKTLDPDATGEATVVTITCARSLPTQTFVPPTVMPAILMVGQPTPTGTD